MFWKIETNKDVYGVLSSHRILLMVLMNLGIDSLMQSVDFYDSKNENGVYIKARRHIIIHDKIRHEILKRRHDQI